MTKTYIGIDFGEKTGDKTVVAHAKLGKNGIVGIYYDEYSEMPNYKWYRNPIKWYKWRRMWKIIERTSKKVTSGRAK